MFYFKKSLILLFILLSSSGSINAQICQLVALNSRFSLNNNVIITDNKTGLIWKKCSEGLSGIDCSIGNAQMYTWQQALVHVQTLNASGGFAGYSDWRIPNIKELISITDKRCVNPSINSTSFPATPNYWFWSSSSYINNDEAWYGNFSDGYSGHSFKLDYNNVRLVR